jgi:translation initiation factor IF-1
MTDTNQKTSKEEGEGMVAFGVVTEALPNTLFRVQLTGEDKTILAYLAGKMRLHRIRVLVGDKVEVLLDPYGGKGRITRRS